MTDKAEIRREMRLRRKALTPEAKARASSVICALLPKGPDLSPLLDPFDGDGALAVYLASPDEIDLTAFIAENLACGVTVVAPRWNGETYELAKLKGLSEEHLRRGPMNILEPAEADLVVPREVAVWIVPGLAFTRDGKRLGYGGGWYDRLMAQSAKDALRIGVAHAFQVVDDLPSEPHDIPLTEVVDDCLDDPLVDFKETADGFRAVLSMDKTKVRRLTLLASLVGLPIASGLIWFLAGLLRKDPCSGMVWTMIGLLALSAVAFLASVIALLYTFGAPMAAELEVRGDEGRCRRRFLGWPIGRCVRFAWKPWTRACLTRVDFYSAPGGCWLGVSAGGVERPLARVNEKTARRLFVRMNLAHRVDPSEAAAARQQVFDDLPRGMVLERKGDVTTIRVRVPTLAGLPAVMFAGFALWSFAAIACLSLHSCLPRPVTWGLLFVASLAVLGIIVHHALWGLFGRHRLTVAEAVCTYETCLGPWGRSARIALASCSCVEVASGALIVTDADGEPHTCFSDLPCRCYLPLELLVQEAIDRLRRPHAD